MSSYPFDEPSFESQSQQATPGGLEQPEWGGMPSRVPPSPPAALPDLDLVDDADRLEVFINLPGFAEEDITLRGDETHLVVTGERQSDIGDGQSVVVQERPVKVERTVLLPTPVDIGNAEAEFYDGVCRVELPKTAAEQYKEIRFR